MNKKLKKILNKKIFFPLTNRSLGHFFTHSPTPLTHTHTHTHTHTRARARARIPNVCADMISINSNEYFNKFKRDRNDAIHCKKNVCGKRRSSIINHKDDYVKVR